MAAKERYAEPTYLECGFGELEHRVIGREICCGCGTCEAFCPRIEHRESRPALVDYDPLCGLCYAYCPRTFLDMGEMERRLFGRTREAAEPLGVYRRVASARARERQSRAQDGGVVTALLVQALESGTIDCAVVTDRDEDWRTLPRVATSPEEVISAAGTKYTISNSVVAVAEAIERGFRRIGFVGTPCQIQALRKTQLVEEPYEIGQRRISLLIGLFCMENFGYQDLMDGLVRGRFGLDPKEVARFEIKRGMFRALDSTGGVHEVRLEETDPYVFKGCGPCFDFASELADISVGSVGSGDGWSTVLTRTDAGEALYGMALSSGAVQEKEVSERGLALAARLAEGKARRFEKRSQELNVGGISR